jgi:hypothetical protein
MNSEAGQLTSPNPAEKVKNRKFGNLVRDR